MQWAMAATAAGLCAPLQGAHVTALQGGPGRRGFVHVPAVAHGRVLARVGAGVQR